MNHLPFNSINLVIIGRKLSILWVIMMVVIPFLDFAKFYTMIFSLVLSTPAVASSSKSNLGCLTKALAIMILCFYPPERLLPFV